jgi:hypothetical protein
MKIWGWRPLLAWHGPVQNNLVQHFICEFRTTSNTSAPNIKVLHSNKHGNHTGLKEQDADK